MTRKMKDSGVEWIGKIPEDWNIIILKRTIKSRMGGAWGDTPKNNENDIICIRIADFEYTKLKIKQNVTYTKRNYANDTINKLTLKKGDILVEKSGGGELTPVGRTVIFKLPVLALYANFIDRLRIYKDISSDYIQYLLVSFYYNGITKKYVKQTTGIQNLDLTTMLLKEKIPLPIIKEQYSISNYLDTKCTKIDQTIERQKQVIEKLKEYKKSIITEAVTKGLNTNVKMKHSGVEWIGEIPENWKIRKIKY
ncbi:restriction endonuclease subunit S, partial [Vallitalea maricola]|uniref:restriction endonuclease subunit S n=1 Tax=Vallitalea maricola TaxID=3074433 RepID=UPI0030DD606A